MHVHASQDALAQKRVHVILGSSTQNVRVVGVCGWGWKNGGMWGQGGGELHSIMNMPQGDHSHELDVTPNFSLMRRKIGFSPGQRGDHNGTASSSNSHDVDDTYSHVHILAQTHTPRAR